MFYAYKFNVLMYKSLFGKHISENFKESKPRLLTRTDNLLFLLSIVGLLVFLYDFGFVHSVWGKSMLRHYYGIHALAIFSVLTFRLFLMKKLGRARTWFWVEYVLILLLVAGMLVSFFSDQFYFGHTRFEQFIKENFFTIGVNFYVFLIELSKRSVNLYHMRFNPALLFVASFIVLIFIGTGLLMLPKATVGGISPLDALFTAASAVCVTGLIVVDTATFFTTFGKVVILLMIQVGGLGIMTFTSFLAMFFQQSSSFNNQLFMQDLINEEKLGNTMRTVGKIVGVTLAVEAVGACLIYATISPAPFDGIHDRAGFAIFHAISAFCNAGFSTLTDGLYDTGLRYNYHFQLVIMLLVIIGGLGFPIMFNLYRYMKQVINNRLRQLRYQEPYVHTSRVVNVNSKIVLITTAVLLVGGTIVYFMTEYDSTLRGHSGYGKFITSLFGAVTPRTAGFNTVDMTQLTLPIVLVYLLLMWIGASPGSTGGGIKTTTIALAVLNAFSITRGKDRVEAFSREISSKSVRQAFAVMLLSILVIGLATLAIAFFERDIPLISVAFEAFSAFSTVGLTLGITGDLSTGSKVVIIITMFLGRVGIFTLIASLLTKVSAMHHQYPSESIIIT